MNRKIVLGAMALALTVSHIWAQTPPPQSKSPGAPELAGLLEKSGYRYTKIRDGVWEITFAGKNTGQFPVRIALTDNTVVVLAKLADRAELKLQPPFLIKMLEINDKFGHFGGCAVLGLLPAIHERRRFIVAAVIALALCRGVSKLAMWSRTRRGSVLGWRRGSVLGWQIPICATGNINEPTPPG